MKQELVVFDMDDVIAKMRFETSRVFSQISGKNVPIEEWDIFCSEHLYGVKFCPDMMMKERIIENCQVEEDATDAFEYLSSKGFKTAIVTARGWHNRGVEATEEWLESKGIQVDHLHVIQLHEKKYDIFSKIQKSFHINAFIDDQPKYLEQALEHEAVKQVFAFNRPWNRKVDPQIKRVDSLLEFAKNI